MKKIIILFLLISQITFAQDTSLSKNEIIVDYIRESMGKKIMQGVCSELIDGAMEVLAEAGYETKALYEVIPDSAMPGDIMTFDKVITADGDKMDNHIAIFKNKLSNDKISYAHQNVFTKSKEQSKVMVNGNKINVYTDSHVIVSIIHPPSIKSGKIKFYRF